MVKYVFVLWLMSPTMQLEKHEVFFTSLYVCEVVEASFRYPQRKVKYREIKNRYFSDKYGIPRYFEECKPLGPEA